LAERIGGVLLANAILNFTAFFVHTMAQRGSAGNGKREGDRYFVGDHGRYGEVPEWRWRVTRVHEISVFVTHPLAVLIGMPLLVYAHRARAREQGTPN
jgi:hypothetical protein